MKCIFHFTNTLHLLGCWLNLSITPEQFSISSLRTYMDALTQSRIEITLALEQEK